MPIQRQFVIGCIVGTRPELIKMAPIIFKLKASAWAKVLFINTAQHRSLLDDMLTLFDLAPDVDLDVMTVDQSLGGLTASLCKKLENLVNNQYFDALLAAGDTTTVFVSSLIAFYHHIPFGHIEAGLRTYNSKEPFPEEINRILTAPLAVWHFAPTELEKVNLLRENIASAKIVVTGNPVIDSLYWVLKHKPADDLYTHWHNIVLVTAHRRENFGEPIKNICQAVIKLSKQFPHVHFLFPVHPNPNVQKDIHAMLNKKPGIHLLPPLRYDEFAHLMNRCLLVLTDSGGIQEEAPALNKPVVILRKITERPAVISEGVGVLVGTKTQQIVSKVSELLSSEAAYSKMTPGKSPYGDGHAAERIVNYVKQQLTAMQRK
ncbi:MULTISPECIES: non-hydrolyzing UDP-N-acetylglucosamine 2-epimerase [Legionella]|uniref:UDP-N-acetylglucosamine 2-epimerase (non-hydrolyzing) n=1 Tax=Legionella septentrionalis TaxID=2498109 RepID=A0A3S0XFR6_9GAMM|nr:MULTISPECIES: UDP-N-acetylglucosamine 2-epimerase (non-hydrolyzing) [Legionella]MCP0913406.1 UDP-N-acetylglucosamine 2-epimerase (non-hydrolyzing) [Legionella sp. 27cVA30]RUQ84950.1 UDP-N-acetylglucosamine 2-epimerase (non-hydrolyzing) [Legionella septentrionalis]RUQ95097.1 UDP-N-acetylglucosamine 2-epimerase (non-hydrolyzing) [Legionella septentrionalis]RUR09854.1 UDP-N-acetylglucosamine 2-epimerase (non-hydrolyzing) [Legionella septentrionalis]RUR13553.1 UDP-N-acetylglucosamine 2-epimeras